MTADNSKSRMKRVAIQSSAGGFTIGEQHTGWASTVVSCDWACTTEEQAVLREITWQFEHLRNLVGVPLSVHVSKHTKESSAVDATTASDGEFGMPIEHRVVIPSSSGRAKKPNSDSITDELVPRKEGLPRLTPALPRVRREG